MSKKTETTDGFKLAITEHLEGLASNDKLFAKTLQKPNKNIDDCLTYIINQVKESGRIGFADDEVFGMAVHYYDEDDLEVGKSIKGKVVINRSIPLTDEEVAQAKQEALIQIVNDEKRRLTEKKLKKSDSKETNDTQPTLF